MNKFDNYQLALSLARAETEDDVKLILQKCGFWHSPTNWRYFGDVENNYSTIGNQQSAADAALVEKLVNSIDAVLMKKCIQKGINPESSQAPSSIKQALIEFYGIRNGDISNLDIKTRNNMSRDIILAATGTGQHPNYIIADLGEGQTPKNMPNSILSIGKSNKLKVLFVQGKYNMGGTGVFRFCGPKYNIQVILSKRCPDIADHSDPTYNNWGFTVIRREAAMDGRKSSMYKYLTDENGNILYFESDDLHIIPLPNSQFQPFPYGMFIKLFDYNLSGYKTNILFDLNYRLALLMPKMAYPIRLIECRKNYSGHSFETTLSGLDVRLRDDRSGNIEPDFPDSFQFRCLNQEFIGSIYVFKEKARVENFKKNEGIIFTINGQTHASLPKSFFRRKNNEMGLSYLADSLLVTVDCTKLDIIQREDLFMNSRDRLCECDLKKAVEKELSEYLKAHSGLKKLQSERRKNALASKLQDEKPFADVINNILSKSPTLAKLFVSGEAIKNPYNIQSASTAETFNGKDKVS
jgi:hypothetical protein